MFSAVFSGAETAITSYGELKAEHLLQRLGRRGHVLRLWLAEPAKVLTTILVGNNLVNILASALATDVALQLFPETGVLVATVVMTLSLLIFGEVIPKVFARAYSERLVLISLHFVRVVGFVLYPAVAVLSRLVSGWLRRSGAEKGRSTVTEEELAFLVELGERQGSLEKEKKRLLQNVFEFGNTIVREVMTPRMDMVSVSSESLGEQAVDIMMAKGHTRLPVHEERIDNIIGTVHAKDLLRRAKETGGLSFSVRSVLREPFLIPETKTLNELLHEMRKRKSQMAIVLDEYGGTAGLITFEDLIEEIVGEVRDEYDEQEEDPIQGLGGGKYLVNASMNYADFEKAFVDYLKPEEPDEEHHEEPLYDTVGGMIVDRFGRIPNKGEMLQLGRLELRVAEGGRRRVRKVQVQVLGALAGKLNQKSSVDEAS